MKNHFFLFFILFFSSMGSANNLPHTIIASYDIATNFVTLSYRPNIGNNKDIVYWDSNNNTYFRAIHIETNSNVIFTLDEQKSTQHFYFDKKQCEYAKYLGAVSSNQLVYLRFLNNENSLQTNVITIDKLDDTYIELWGGGELTGGFIQIVSNTYTFYPKSLFSYTNTVDPTTPWRRKGTTLILTPYER